MPSLLSAFKPKDLTFTEGANSVTVTNLSLPVISTEVSLTLQSNLKGVIIRSRTAANVQIAFVATESGTKYLTIPRGTSLSLDVLNFTGKTLYAQADKVTTLEIVEFHN